MAARSSNDFACCSTRARDGEAQALFGAAHRRRHERQQLTAHAMQLGQISALERPLRVREAFVDGQETFVDAPRAREQLGEEGEKRRADEAGSDRLLHRQAVLQLVDALGGPAERGEGSALERRGPIRSPA